MFVLRIVLVGKSVLSDIFTSEVYVLALSSVSLTTSFLTTWLILIKSTGIGSNLSKSKLSTLIFKFLNSFCKLFNLSTSNLSTLGF